MDFLMTRFEKYLLPFDDFRLNYNADLDNKNKFLYLNTICNKLKA